MEREDLAGWLRLALTPQVGRTTARRLLAAFGLPARVFDQPAGALGTVAGAAQVQALLQPPPGWPAALDATCDWLQSAPAGITRRVLTLADADYPASLLQTEDPPLLLYTSGVPVAWPRAIAVVGSRNPTAQGERTARDFARAFAGSGWAVVSGLALGIDAAAHAGALDGAAPDQLATIAVVGTGLDQVYPRRNRELAARIAQHGMLVSEYPLGTPPLAENFPQRNRILSALGEGTLVVEAALASGSLITARLAAEQGRDVFAIPGSIHSPLSRGCHALIRQGAKLVETAQDVLEELAPHERQAPSVGAGAPAAGAVAPLLDAMGFDPVSLDALVARTGEHASRLQAQLLDLELEGRVARLPGGMFQRLASA